LNANKLRVYKVTPSFAVKTRRRREACSREKRSFWNNLLISRWRWQPKRSSRRLLFGISRRPEDHTISSI